MAPSPAKRAKTGLGGHVSEIRSPSQPLTSQPKLRDLFARPQKLNAAEEARRREEEELAWAIKESLKGSENHASVATSTKDEGQYSLSKCSVDENSSKNSPQALATSRPAARPLQPHDAQVQQVVGTLSETSDTRSADTSLSSIMSVGSLGEAEAEHLVEAAPAPVTSSRHTKPFNAFSKLMSTHSEAKEWATADIVESRNYNGAARSRPQRRTAPFYKVLTGMPISVDAFRFGDIEGCNAYFLSHFHSDHYGGLTSTWMHGPVYCSVTTANLVRSSLRVNDLHICPLPMNETVVVPHTGGVRVTLLDANHCPGSCLFLFEGPQTRHILPTPPNFAHPPLPPPSRMFRYLHCGDFRASPRHVNHPLVKGKYLDIIYLDTTYCNPRYCFPAQEMVVNACADLVRRAAPEQCRLGQLHEEDAVKGPFDCEEQDWRTSPLKGKMLQHAIDEEENRHSANALRGWLLGTKAEADGSVGEVKAVKAETSRSWADAEAKAPEEVVHDDEELGEMDFRDEEVAFAEDLSFARQHDAETEENGEEGLAKTGERGGRAPNADTTAFGDGEALICVKEEECDDEIRIECAPKSEEDEEAPMEDKAWKRAVVNSEATDVKPSVSFDDDYTRVLVVVGTYTIGKEKIVMACAHALGTRVYCADPRKYRVYAQLDDPALHSLLTRDPTKAYVHVTSLHAINGEALQEHASRMRAQGMRIDRAIAFRPTGWTYKPPSGMDLVSPSLDRLVQWNQRRTFTSYQLFSTRDSTSRHTIFGVPYSEHSSFFELTAFCLSVDYGRIIATVNVGSPASRAKMTRWFDKWKAEKKRREGVAVESRALDYF